MKNLYKPDKDKDKILYHLPGWITILAEYFGKHAEQKRKLIVASKLEKELHKNET